MNNITPQNTKIDDLSARESLSPDPEIIKARINSRMELYQTIAGKAGFSIEFGDKTCFNHESSTIILGLDQLLKMDVSSQEEIDFIVLHELGHFKELYDDPKGYMEVIKEGSREDGLGQVYFGLYNALMDIYVNTNTANKAGLFSSAKFRGESGSFFSDKIRDLYSEKTFKERDFSTRPLCVQYCDYLLNLGMECGESITLSPEVKSEIDKGIVDLTGDSLSYEKLINTYLRPVLAGKATREWSASISQRKMIIDMYIRPVFEKLIRKDIENGKTQDMQSSEGGDLAIAKEIIKDALARNAEKNLSQSDKQKIEREKQIKNLIRNSGLNPEQVGNFLNAYNKMYPVMLELAELWKRIRQRDISYKPEDKGHFPKGHKLDIQKVIEEFPAISSGEDNSRIMYKRIFEENYDFNPKKLWLTIVPDMSGSMSDDIEKVQELCIALAGSFSIINQEQDDAADSLRCQLSVIGFDHEVHPLLISNDDTHIAHVAEIYAKIQAIGSTSDHLALEFYQNLLTESLQEKIKSGEILPVLIEITDGDTSDSALSRKLVNELEATGVQIQGIRFGYGLKSDEKPKKDNRELGIKDPAALKKELEALQARNETFDKVWNADGGLRGHRIWNAEDIVPKVYELLEQFIDND